MHTKIGDIQNAAIGCNKVTHAEMRLVRLKKRPIESVSYFSPSRVLSPQNRSTLRCRGNGLAAVTQTAKSNFSTGRP